MPDAIWIDKNDQLSTLARTLESRALIGVDTEFLRERTFFPKLCLLQLAADGDIWCVDTLRGGSLEPLVAVLTAATTSKIIHAARQDLEAFYLTARRVISPVFDTQIAAGCIGLKPQVGYAELVKTLLDVTLSKGQTRTDWSKRPLTPEQLEYAADDVLYLGEIAQRLMAKLRVLGREHWVAEDCAALQDPQLYEPDPALAWERLRGLGALAPAPRARARGIAVWREKLARERDLPRAWIISDAAIFAVAQMNPGSRAALGALHAMPANFNEGFAASLLDTLREASNAPVIDREPSQDSRPTPEQKARIERLGSIVDARAAELGVSAEILAPRGEIKALAMGRRESHALSGWRRQEIGERLLENLD
jgi:ribonuclease D